MSHSPRGWQSYFPALLAIWLLAGLAACSRPSDAIVSIALHPTNDKIIYVATNDSVFKTRDGGASWEKMATDLSSYRVLSLALDPLHPASVYAGTMGDAVYKSPDGGQRWIAHNAGLKEHVSVVNRFVFDPRDSDMIYAATTVGVFRSTDGGRLWEERMTGMKEVHIVFTLAMDPRQPHVFYAGTSGGAYRSLDGTATWQKVNTGLIPAEILDASLSLGVSAIAIDPRDPTTLYAGTNNGLFKSTNRAESWTRIGQSLSDQYISSVVIDPTNPSILYVGGRAGVHKTLDAGQTWQDANTGLATLNIRTIMMSPQNPQTLYAGTNGSGLYRSQDGGQHWSALPLTAAASRPAGG